jgi:ATP-dependent DNA helicase RecG
MTISVVPIAAEQTDRILALDESHFLDLKSLDIAPAKLTRTIAALANASGGELYVGIDEQTVGGKKTRNWRGFSDPEAANAHLQVFDQLFPLGQYFSYVFLSSPICPGLVLQVCVNKTREITKASNRVVYLRRGAQTYRLLQMTGFVGFDSTREYRRSKRRLSMFQ